MEGEKLILLFPTPVFRYTDLGLDNQRILRAVTEETGTDFYRNQSPGNYTSGDHKLHERPSLRPLVEAIESRARHALDHHLGYEFEDLAINTMWCNVQSPDDMAGHHFHEHSNSFFSGTYYVEVHDEQSPIVFQSPLRVKMIAPAIKQRNRLNAEQSAVPVSTGDLLMWPSELRHGIVPYHSPNRRVSISFNIMFKGWLGGPTWQHRY